MARGLRLSEKWFNRGLWLVALVFAGFLIGLGSTVVGDLPRVEQARTLEDFMDPAALARERAAKAAAEQQQHDAGEALAQQRLALETARSDVTAASDALRNWLATRQATQRPEQDGELIERTRALDGLRVRQRTAEQALQRQQQRALDAEQAAARADQAIAQLEAGAQRAYGAEQRRLELRVFLYRLALTLPLLAIAGWLFARRRKSRWWPFVWGFIFFALFAFFVELVPYLPSYGGYVRQIVGIVITVVVGRQAVLALQRYRERQLAAEALPDTVRREELSYDTALARLAKGVCPGCERPVELNNPLIDFCPHCGICLWDHCQRCDARKGAFARFCHACGTPAQAAPGTSAASVAPAAPAAPVVFTAAAPPGTLTGAAVAPELRP